MPRGYAAAFLAVVLCVVVGCQSTPAPSSPAAAGFNTRDLIDPDAQQEADALTPAGQLVAVAEALRKDRQQQLAAAVRPAGGSSPARPAKTVLCLSGGGSYGAYPAGVLCGWTERGDRPEFDVVTGISTGALIAPFAFLGPKYDAPLKRFYTALEGKDLYRLRLHRAFAGEAFVDPAPLAARIDGFLTPAVMADLAAAHRRGRRLYVGTTEEEGGQFVVWDVGAMAARNDPGDRALIAQVLLASASPAGFFPAGRIGVTVDGVRHTERHVDGGISQALFFRPPYVPPDERSEAAARDLAGTKVYVLVAGKLYADPEVSRPWCAVRAGKSVSALIYAQTRGDLQRLYTVCLLAGMDYAVSAIPPEYAAARSCMDFSHAAMTGLFEEGRRVIGSPTPWRTLPPGVGDGESPLARAGPRLTHRPRGPLLPIAGPNGTTIPCRHLGGDPGVVPVVGFQPPAE